MLSSPTCFPSEQLLPIRSTGKLESSRTFDANAQGPLRREGLDAVENVSVTTGKWKTLPRSLGTAQREGATKSACTLYCDSSALRRSRSTTAVPTSKRALLTGELDDERALQRLLDRGPGCSIRSPPLPRSAETTKNSSINPYLQLRRLSSTGRDSSLRHGQRTSPRTGWNVC